MAFRKIVNGSALPKGVETADNVNSTIESTVETSLAALVASAPAALDTLNELAAALGDDENFATTVTNSLADKAPLASPTFTGTVAGVTKTHVGLGNVDNTSDANKPVSTATQTALDAKSATSHTHTTSQITDYTPVDISGKQDKVANVSDTEIGYLNGVTSAIQTQINGKLSADSPTITNPTLDLDYSGTASYPGLSGSSYFDQQGGQYVISVTQNQEYLPEGTFVSGDIISFTSIEYYQGQSLIGAPLAVVSSINQQGSTIVNVTTSDQGVGQELSQLYFQVATISKTATVNAQITPAMLATLDGIDSNIQDQIDLRGLKVYTSNTNISAPEDNLSNNGPYGNHNISIGFSSMYYQPFDTTGGGQNNVAIGTSTLYNLSYGGANTAIGFGALGTTTTGGNNVGLGNGANASSASANNEITLGNSSITNLRCNDTTISGLSDARDKKDVEDMQLGLDFINKVRPVKFTWDQRDGGRVDIADSGFIAQELMAVEDEYDANDWLKLTSRNNEERYEAAPARLIPILVKAVQELSQEVEELKSRLASS